MNTDLRRCYIRQRVLLEALCDPKIADVLVSELGVPGKTRVLKGLDDDAKRQALILHAKNLVQTPTSHYYQADLEDVLAASLFLSEKLSSKTVRTIFSGVKKESDLVGPVGLWLKARGNDIYQEVPMGTKRADVVGVRPGGLFRSETIVAVELKNDCAQLKRGLDQMATFGDYSHSVYMACTPALGAEFLCSHMAARGVKHWDPDALNRRLSEFGFGLLIVEGSEVYEVLTPKKRSPSTVKASELTDVLKGLPHL